MKRISDAKNCKRISFRSVKIPGIILMAATLLLITGSLDSNDAYATHLTPDTKWQLVSISSYPACTVLNAHPMHNHPKNFSYIDHIFRQLDGLNLR